VITARPPPPFSHLLPYTTLFRSVVSHAFWRRTSGLDPAFLGRKLEINGRLFEVIGVLPPEFRYPAETDIWLPYPKDDWSYRQSSDRKSTRLNSSHDQISYAVFCL